MAKYAYIRVSSEKQTYAQQQECISRYISTMGLDFTQLDDVVSEKISGRVRHDDRLLARLMDKCTEGDLVLVSELSRLGRDVADLFNVVKELCEKGTKIIQCKDNLTIDNRGMVGKIVLMMLAMCAEIEVENIRDRTRMGLEARKEKQRTQGGWVSNSGNWCESLGNKKGCDMSAANKASCKVRVDAAAAWRARSVGYKFVKRMRMEGWSFKKILDEFQKMAAIDPKNYCSRQGRPMTGGILSKWIDQIDKEISINPQIN